MSVSRYSIVWPSRCRQINVRAIGAIWAGRLTRRIPVRWHKLFLHVQGKPYPFLRWSLISLLLGWLRMVFTSVRFVICKRFWLLWCWSIRRSSFTRIVLWQFARVAVTIQRRRRLCVEQLPCFQWFCRAAIMVFGPCGWWWGGQGPQRGRWCRGRRWGVFRILDKSLLACLLGVCWRALGGSFLA